MSANVREKLNILVVALPLPITGGGFRAFRSIKEYTKHFNTYLFIPWGLWDDKKSLQMAMNYLRGLKGIGGRCAGFSRLPRIVHKLREISGMRIFESLLPLAVPNMARANVGAMNYDAVVVLHEVWDAVLGGSILAELFDIPSAVLLQLPPFYGSQRRFFNVMKATLLWRELISDTPIERVMFKLEAITRGSVEEYLRKSRYEKTLREYALVLGVSKAIAVEMGNGWLDKVICFDPGVSLDYEDLELMKNIKRKIWEKENYIVLGGRPSIDKGLVEALITLKLLSKRFPRIKLVVTGRVAPVISRIKKVCKRLGVEDKVVFTGFVSREKRLEIIAKAKLMLYPSHVDAFPYAVLESLHLGTPIVAYRIPALEIYYDKCPGVELVEECDVEALTIKAIDVLEKGVEAVEPPKIKSWREIMSEEVELILRLASR
jgi:glycosyltransferase involved in cell wall biosynthesis